MIVRCPMCKAQLDLSDPDTVYPNAIGWIEVPEVGRTYCSHREVPKEQWCYHAVCSCGFEYTADSEKEVINKMIEVNEQIAKYKESTPYKEESIQDALKEAFKKLSESQEPLGEEFTLSNEQLWQLLEESNKDA